MQQISRALLATSTMTLLAACSADTPAEAPAAAMAPSAPNATMIVEYAPQPAAPASNANRVLAASVNVLVAPPQVSESERVAEQLRLVDFEQSFSREMNRRNQEQAERSERAAVAVRAGVVQGPGCEGTEGHTAVECEQSLI